MTYLRKCLAVLLLGMTLFSAACSAEGKVDGGSDGDGVKIEGDVDANKD